MDPFPFKKPMHVIFLRNVMIYFDHATRERLIKKIYDILVPGGYLFIGRTETLDRGNNHFQMIQPSIFRKPV
jgi:chemotaxis protein methyltransferase CheR